MSLRQVLTIFKSERELNDDEVAFLNTLRRMTGPELELLGIALAPQAKPKPRKKREVKSARASSLQQQIAGAGSKPKIVHLGGLCVFRYNDGTVCDEPEENKVHDKDSGYAGYHEFQPPQKAAATGD